MIPMTEQPSHRAPVVVGVDGSPAAEPALDWAAHEATLTGRPLRMIYGLDRLLHEAPLSAHLPLPKINEAAGEQVLREATRRVAELEPGVPVETRVIARPAADALVMESAAAYETVVGRHGRGAVGRAVLGSASLRVVALAHGPVVVVLATAARAGGEIVAGVDGSTIGGAVVEFAFAQAQRRGLPLRVLHAWLPPISLFSDHYPYDLYAAELKASRVADDLISTIGPRFPEVKATAQVVQDHPARALSEVSKTAALLVVGSRGLTGATRFFLGSVSTALLHHADCPLAVLPSGIPTHPAAPAD